MLSIREVEEKDCKKLFQWANDPQTRSNSLNSTEIKYENHIKWFKSKLNDENSHLFLCYNIDEEIGLIRFEKKNDKWNVGIVIDPQARGKGFGKETLNLGLQEFSKLYTDVVLAQIKEDNIGSIKIFEANGFKIINTVNSVHNLKWINK